MHDETILGEFTHQAQTFNRSAVANAPALLEALIDLAAPRSDERWVDVACGPGVVTRALAPHVAEVRGIDATPAMVELAREQAPANATFTLGDATALELSDASVDGAINRFALHHIPVCERVIDELARVVAPGGHVVICDSVAAPDVAGYAWCQEIERLRDPSHWATPSAAQVRDHAARRGLTLEEERFLELEIDFEDWLARGSGHVNAAAIDAAIALRPQGSECFSVRSTPGGRVLDYRVMLMRWRR